MKRRLTLTCAAALLACAAAPACAQSKAPLAQLGPGSEITFAIKQMGVPVEGRFDKFSGQIALDPKRPETGSVSFSIDTNSARFGAAEIDTEVVKPVWLGVAKFPQATFQSSSIRPGGPGKFEVAGVLSIKGSTQNVVVPVQVTQTGPASTATGSFTIKRLMFKIGEGDWADTSMVADEVQVRFKLQLTGLPPI